MHLPALESRSVFNAGTWQTLSLFCSPPPHVLLQVDQAFQGDQAVKIYMEFEVGSFTGVSVRNHPTVNSLPPPPSEFYIESFPTTIDLFHKTWYIFTRGIQVLKQGLWPPNPYPIKNHLEFDALFQANAWLSNCPFNTFLTTLVTSF